MTYQAPNTLIDPFREALYNGNKQSLQAAFDKIFCEQALIQLCFPFETLPKPRDLVETVYDNLQTAIPDLERRDTIVMQGPASSGETWIGCCGYYTGSFMKPWLEIPATGRQVSLRFHEFFKLRGDKIVEMQAIWDIPELMMQANVWPLSPSLGREWHVPGPSTQDGLIRLIRDKQHSNASLERVAQMCRDLGKFADGGTEAMLLEHHWHPHCSWYGPSGIGTGRGLRGFRHCHQIPFLNALPNRVGNTEEGHLFADNDYVGFTAWPGMHMTISNGGWLGIAPGQQKITMRSLDFWRVENGLIRENWVLIDLLDVYQQIGVDVFARMRELDMLRPSLES